MNRPIAAGNVVMKMSAGGLYSEAQRIKKEMNQLKAIVKASTPAAEIYSQRLDLLKSGMASGAISAKQFAQAKEFLNAKYGQGQRSIVEEAGKLAKQIPVVRNLTSSVTSLSGVLGGVGPVSIAAGVGLAGMVASAAAVAAGFEAVRLAAHQMMNEAKKVDEIGDQAKKLGMSFNDLLILRKSLSETSGLDDDTIGKSMQRMQLGLIEAARGQGDLVKQFRVLGIDAKRLIDMGPVESMKVLAEQTKRMKDESSQLAFAYELFGKQGAQLVLSLREGPNAIADMAKHAQEFGLTLTQVQVEQIGAMNDSFGRLKDTSSGIFRQTAAEFAPALKAAADEARALLSHFNGIRPVLPALVDEVARMTGGILDSGAAINGVIQGYRETMKGNVKYAQYLIYQGFNANHGEMILKRIRQERKRVADEEKQRQSKGSSPRFDFEAELERLEKLKESAGIGRGENHLVSLAKRVGEHWKELADYAKDVQQRAQAIRDRQNPMVPAIREAQSIMELFRLGAINRNMADNELARLAKELVKNESRSKGDTSPGLRKADSAEAYNFIMNQRSETVRKLEEQRKIQQKQTEILQGIRANTQNMTGIVAVG